MKTRFILALNVLAMCGPVAMTPNPAAAAFLSTTAADDVTLESGNPNTNRGSDILVVGNTGGPGRRHSLVRFGDIESLIGSGKNVLSAKLSLRVEGINGVAPGNLLGAFAATTDWTEGNGTGAGTGAAPFGATWNAAKREGADGIGEGETGDTDGPITWTNPGGDFVGSTGVQATNAFATATVNGNYYEFDVTSLVQGWYDGSIANHGFALTPLTNVSAQFGRVSFRTTETNPNNLDNHPRLEIEYNVPEPSASLLVAFLVAIGLLGNRRDW
jgi:hypothetical protein